MPNNNGDEDPHFAEKLVKGMGGGPTKPREKKSFLGEFISEAKAGLERIPHLAKRKFSFKLSEGEKKEFGEFKKLASQRAKAYGGRAKSGLARMRIEQDTFGRRRNGNGFRHRNISRPLRRRRVYRESNPFEVRFDMPDFGY